MNTDSTPYPIGTPGTPWGEAERAESETPALDADARGASGGERVSQSSLVEDSPEPASNNSSSDVEIDSVADRPSASKRADQAAADTKSGKRAAPVSKISDTMTARIDW